MQERTQISFVFPETAISSRREDHSWQPLLHESLRSSALEAVYTVAERLRDPQTVETIAQRAAQQATYFAGWMPPSLSSGFGGTALLFLFLARSFPEQGWEDVARHHLHLAAQGTQQIPFMWPALFNGSSGLATVLSFFTQDDHRYHRTLQTLNERVAAQVLGKNWRREDTRGVAYDDYDIISGASGILGYLITLNQPGKQIQGAIEKLLEYLVWLASSDSPQEHKRWFLLPELYPTPSHGKSYPDGYFNCGLAHGVAGLLAALALAWQAGYRIAGQREAIQEVSQWLIMHQFHDQWGTNWPSGIALQQSSSGSQWPIRTAWCYGAPGIARALWLSGIALNDVALSQQAVDAIEDVLKRPIATRNIDSVTFCHGVAGLLAICLRFAQEMRGGLVTEHIPLLVKQILEGFNPEYPFGFRDQEFPNSWVNDPGLLTGTTGVGLVLLAAAAATEPAWDRIFLIA